MPWILILIALGIIRGLLVPDYSTPESLLVIPLLTPVVLAILAAYFYAIGKLSLMAANLAGLVSVWGSTLLGAMIFVRRSDLDSLWDDPVSQSVFLLTIVAQTFVYLITSGLALVVARRLRKSPPEQQPVDQ